MLIPSVLEEIRVENLLLDNTFVNEQYDAMTNPGSHLPVTTVQPPRLGLIGGMSWRSTADYYARINLASESRRGAHRNVATLVDTLEFAPLLEAGGRGAWDEVTAAVVAAGRRLEAAGCTAAALTSVTAHRCHAELEAALGITVPHILDPAAAYLAAHGLTRVGLLGTSRMLSAPAVQARLSGGGARAVVVPDAAVQADLDRLILDRLTQGRVDAAGRWLLEAAAAALRRDGVQAILLACTELPLLLQPERPGMADMIDAVALHVDHLCELVTDEMTDKPS